MNKPHSKPDPNRQGKAASAQASARALVEAALALRGAMERLSFAAPVAFVYHPLVYAWDAHRRYIEKFGGGDKEILVVGMNPGPFGMAQTGVPFGEVSLVSTWMGITADVGKPPREHPARPVLGFRSTRREVSGARLWGAIAKKFPDARDFFATHYVISFCPLLFLDDGGRNLTPDKIARADRAPMEMACADHLRAVIAALKPTCIVAVGGYAAQRASSVTGLRVVPIPHPSPASPQANRDWVGGARKALVAGGLSPFL